MMQLKKSKTKMIYALLAGVFLALTALFIVQAAGFPAQQTADPLHTVSFSGSTRVDGGHWTELSSGVPDGFRTVHIRGNFSENIPVNETVWILLEHAGAVVTVDGAEVLSANQPGSFPPMLHSPGYGWANFSSPGITPQSEIDITLTAYYDQSAEASGLVVSNLYAGDGLGFYPLLLQKITFFTFLSMVAVFAGMIYLFEGAVDALQKLPEANRILLFGFYFMSGGLWCLTDALYPYYFLFSSPHWLAAFVDMSGMLLMPVALTLLVRFYMRGKKTRAVMTAASFVVLLSVLIFMLFQLLGIADLHQTQFAIAALALVLLTTGLACIILEIKKYHDTYLKLLLLTVAPVFVVIAVDGVSLFFYPAFPFRDAMQYGFGLSFLFSIVQLVSYAKLQKQKEASFHQMQLDLAQSRISVMLSQIQPHFLYNALTVIKGLCRKDPKKAEHAIDNFANFLRSNLDSLSNGQLIPFDQELLHTRHYLEIEQLRFEDRLRVRYDTPVTLFRLPTLTLQPIVENAVRHGISAKAEGVTITIESRETKDAWLVFVKDDGPGFDPLAPLPGKRAHIGIANVRERLFAQCCGTLALTSSQDGTVALISIPKEEAQ